MISGGRYDGLVAQMGGKPTPGVGFAMGVERLVLLLEELNLIPAEVHKQVDIFVIAAGEGTLQQAFIMSEALRDSGNFKVLQNAGGGSFKSQMKKADKSGASIALILGEQELKDNVVIIKPLVSDEKQVSVSQNDILNELNNFLK